LYKAFSRIVGNQRQAEERVLLIGFLIQRHQLVELLGFHLTDANTLGIKGFIQLPHAGLGIGGLGGATFR